MSTPQYRRQFDFARTPYDARNALGITSVSGAAPPFLTDAPSNGRHFGRYNGTWADLDEVYMRWVPYTGAGQAFLKMDLTRDQDWTMVALADTTDRPAPQPTGTEEDLLPIWTPTTSSNPANHVVYNEWTINTAGWVSQYGMDVLNPGKQCAVTLQINGVTKDTFTVTPNTAGLFWNDITPVLVAAGAVIRVTNSVSGSGSLSWYQQAGLFASAPVYCSLAVGSKDGAAAGTTAYGCHVLFQPGTKSPNWDVVAFGGSAAGGGGGGSPVNPSPLTAANDTNITLTLGGTPATALLQASSITAGWTGTLAAGRLNGNVVQAVVNDTNVTGSIAAQTLTLGWTGTLAAARFPALTGDVTNTAGTLATTIANGAVSNAKMANMAANSIKGNNTGSAATPIDLTGTQTTAMLDTVTTSLKGLAPASGGGTTNFLRADLTWAAPTAAAALTSINTMTGPAITIAAGTGISIANASNTVTVTNTASAPSTPTTQVFLTGSGTYTTPANVRWLEVTVIGGGAGGAGGASGGNGTAGGNSTFSTLTGNGAAANSSYIASGTPGAASGGSIFNLSGGSGGSGSAANAAVWTATGGNGGSSILGGAGAGQANAAGRAASQNTGSGGGGGGVTTAVTDFGGNGGSAGGVAHGIITSPAATYSYSVGAGGTGGAAGANGYAAGAGARGIVIVKEFY
jgi:hypothetical protein